MITGNIPTIRTLTFKTDIGADAKSTDFKFYLTQDASWSTDYKKNLYVRVGKVNAEPAYLQATVNASGIFEAGKQAGTLSISNTASDKSVYLTENTSKKVAITYDSSINTYGVRSVKVRAGGTLLYNET